MEKSTIFRKGFATIALAGLLSGIAIPPVALADKVMESAGEPVEVRLNQTLSTETARYGDPFEGTITEDYRLGDQELPAGTVLKGRVNSGHPSMIFGMPGYVAFDIQEAVLPSGDIYEFEKDGKGSLKTKKYNHPKAHTAKRLLMAAVPFSAASAVDAVPLKLAAGMGFWEITPISLAVRMALGVGLELHDKRQTSPVKDYPNQTRVGYGMLRGTGLTGVYHFMTTSPEPNLKEGAVISVRLPEQDMNKLFTAAATVKTEDVVETEPPTEVPVSASDLKSVEATESSREENTVRTAPITDPLPQSGAKSPHIGDEKTDKGNIPAITVPPQSPSPISAVTPKAESSEQ